MRTTLVTGASGNLGSAVVNLLLSRGHRVRAHMRSSTSTSTTPDAAEPFYGDLRGGAGLEAAARGTNAVIHCASFFDADGSTDRLGIRHVIDAAASSTPHLVYISIVGVDRTTFPYFKTKLEVERMVAASGLAHTIVRATQFHDFVHHFIAGFEDPDTQTIALPVGLSFQSIDVGEVAQALVAASEGDPAGRHPDIAGPEVALDEMAKRYVQTLGLERVVTSQREDPQREFTTPSARGVISLQIVPSSVRRTKSVETKRAQGLFLRRGVKGLHFSKSSLGVIFSVFASLTSKSSDGFLTPRSIPEMYVRSISVSKARSS